MGGHSECWNGRQRRTLSGRKLPNSFSCCRELFLYLAVVVFGHPNKNDFIGVVGCKPNCFPEKLIKREKKKKYIVGLAVKSRNKVISTDWKRLSEGRN